MQPCSPPHHRLYYPTLRVTNPSLPTPPIEQFVDRDHRDSKSLLTNRTRIRPAGYTSSGAWLRDCEDHNDFPQRTLIGDFPNPHETDSPHYLPRPPTPRACEDRRFTLLQPPARRRAPHSMMYNDGQDRFRASHAGGMPPSSFRHIQPPIRVSSSSEVSQRRVFAPGLEARDMHMSYSQPSAYSVQTEHTFPMARSTGVSASAHEGCPPLAARPRMGHSYSTGQVSATSRASRSRPAIRLDVHGLSFVDEDMESTFPPVAPYHEYEGGEGSAGRDGGVVMQALSSDNLTPWRPRVHRDSLHRLREQRAMITREPKRQPEMRVVVGNRNARGMPVNTDGTRDWSTDLCLFCDHNLGTCCKALWCPCIIYGRNKARIEHLYAEEDVHPGRGGTCSTDCVVHACLTTFCLFGWAMQISNRAAVRRRYAIEGDCIGDCAAALFCSPCELAQESREIDLEEGSFAESFS